MTSETTDLDRIERWMLEVVTHPDGIAAGVDSKGARDHIEVTTEDLEDVILPSKSLGPIERLEVYGNMYFWRLCEILDDDFAAVRHVVGGETFDRLTRAYLVACPSRSYDLTALGDRFPAFLASDEAADVPHRSFVADLARLERACEEVFDEARAVSIDADTLLEVPPETWGGVSFDFIPAHRLLALDHPIDDFYTAWREDRHEDIPSPEPSWLLLYRRDYTVWRTPLGRDQFTVLSALRDGGTLGDALAAAADLPGADVEQLTASVGPWFQRWTGNGLFSALRRSG